MDKDIEKIFNSIDKKFENMSEEELREYEIEEALNMSKMSGKQYEESKRNKYLNKARKVNK